MSRIPLSVLDLVPVNAESSIHQALNDSLEMAIRADELGFERYWYAEHHNTVSFAS